jgi:hypothetical protein
METFFTMVFGTTSSEAAFVTRSGVWRPSYPERFLKAFVWLLTISFILGMKPSRTNAVTQKRVRKEA